MLVAGNQRIESLATTQPTLTTHLSKAAEVPVTHKSLTTESCNRLTPFFWVNSCDNRIGRATFSPLRALTTGLRWSNHEGHEGLEDVIRRSAETHDRLCDRGSLAPRAGTTTWPRTLLSLIPSCSSCASWSTDRPDLLVCHGNIPRPWRTSRCTGAGESFGFELESHVRPPGNLGRWIVPVHIFRSGLCARRNPVGGATKGSGLFDRHRRSIYHYQVVFYSTKTNLTASPGRGRPAAIRPIDRDQRGPDPFDSTWPLRPAQTVPSVFLGRGYLSYSTSTLSQTDTTVTHVIFAA